MFYCRRMFFAKLYFYGYNVRFLQRDEDVGPRATVFNIRRNIFSKAEVVHLCFEY